ncbi:class II aldolase/adducin family protein [Thermostaphylospora chromogena]|nr:class II aldolase/adducin family protein [Thermostaphylospora chromogena]
MLMAEQRELLCEYGRRAVDLGLVIGTAGNLSVRAGDLVAITPAGVALDRMTPEDCPVLDVAGRLVSGERQPSSETPMHLSVYASTDARAVVHTHSVFGTVVATTMRELPAVHYNILLLGGETVRVAEYATYGTAELAANMRQAMADRRAALLANHGGVTIGPDLDSAFEAARLLEWLCEVYVRAKAVGEPRVLTHEQLAAVRERAANPPAFPRGERPVSTSRTPDAPEACDG